MSEVITRADDNKKKIVNKLREELSNTPLIALVNYEKITVDEIANAACVSKFHFIRMFSEQVGMTPHQYVLISRINKCKMALESGEKAVDMAMELGFSDVSHLNRKFKSIFGITPNQYQRQLFT